MKNKILCIGHSTLDTFFVVKDADVYCRLDKRLCQVSFAFGAKIPVDEIHTGIGGGAANVAIGLSKLGLSPYIHTIVGEDTKGLYIKNNFLENGVGTKYLFSDADDTDQATIISYGVDRTIFTHNTTREYSIDKVEENFQYIFLSSVGDDVSGLYKEIVEAKKSRNFTLFYNPGSKELANAYDDIQYLLPSVDYLIANVDEGCTVLNTSLKRDQIEIWDLLSTLVAQKGVKHAVLTDGENGAYYRSNQDSFHIPVASVEVVERTGAGDAFASGFIAGMVYGIPVREAFLWGAINSAEVIKSFGAQNGLLTREQISERVKHIQNY